MLARTARTAAAAALCGALLAGCSDDPTEVGEAAAVGSPGTGAASAVDLRASVGRTVEILATVDQVLHSNAFVIVDGHVGSTPVLVTTGAVPPGMDVGRTVRITGRVINDPPGSDPVMNEYKAKGPIIEATDVQLP